MVAMAAIVTLSSTVPAAAATNVRVHMHDFQFCPEVNGALQCPGTTAGSVGVVTIHPGDSVTWIYDESSSDVAGCNNPALQLPLPGSPHCPGHTVTKPNQPYHALCVATAGTGCPYTFTFNYSGSFDYYCAYHGGRTQGNTPLTPGVPNMDGRVVVLPSGTNSALDSNVNAGTGRPAGTTTTAASSFDLPNTYVPGLPNAGHRPAGTPWLMLGCAAALGLAGLLLGHFRLLRRR
jgi:hypothetical protein